MLGKGVADFAARGEGLDVFDLDLFNAFEEIPDQQFDDRKEGSVAERAVWARYGPIVGD
jgi:hypothetical protein